MKRGVVFAIVGAVAVLAAVLLWERRDRPSETPRNSAEAEENRRDPDSNDASTPIPSNDDDRVSSEAEDPSSGGTVADPDPDPEPVLRTIEGTVVDDRGEALPGATVAASGSDGPAVRTDGGGRFSIEVDSTVEALDVSLRLYESARIEGLADLGDELRIELARQAMRRIVVEAPDGRLLPGARVALEGADAQTTDTSGVVRIEPAPMRQSARLEVEHPSYEPIERTLTGVEPGEHRTTVVRLEVPRVRTRMAIVVRDSDTRPVADASVQIRHGSGSQVTDFHRTDSSGRLVLEDPDGSWMDGAFGVRVTAKGFEPFARTEIRADMVPGDFEILLYREPLELQVQIVDRAGRPRGGCTVRARKSDGTGSTLIAQTDWQGIARFSRQLEGTAYDVTFGTGVPGGFLPEGGRSVVEPIGHLGLVPYPTISTRSRVVDDASLAGSVRSAAVDSGVETRVLRLACHAGRYVERAHFELDVELGPDGSFRVEGLPAGFYRAWLPNEAGGGSARRPLAVVPLAIGESRTDVEIARSAADPER